MPFWIPIQNSNLGQPGSYSQRPCLTAYADGGDIYPFSVTLETYTRSGVVNQADVQCGLHSHVSSKLKCGLNKTANGINCCWNRVCTRNSDHFRGDWHFVHCESERQCIVGASGQRADRVDVVGWVKVWCVSCFWFPDSNKLIWWEAPERITQRIIGSSSSHIR